VNFTLNGREVKLGKLPRLIRKDATTGKSSGHPYPRWTGLVDAQLDTINGTYVLENDPPTMLDSVEKREWFTLINKVVYNALLDVVAEIPILGSTVSRCRRNANSARMAWFEIEDFYTNKTELSEDTLVAKLYGMNPGPTESMRSYLNRYEELRTEYYTHGVTPDDNAFVRRVFATLAMQWRESVYQHVGHRQTDKIAWEVMCEALLHQDGLRRVSNTSGPDALLPLGWTKREKGAGSSRPAQGEYGNANAGGGQHKGGGYQKGGGNPNSKGGGKWEKPPPKPIMVCFCCLKVGHTVHECPDKPKDWKLTDEQKRKAFEKKDAEAAKRAEQSAKAKAAHAESKGSSSSSKGKEDAAK
jgi:hypothetical protein